MSDKIREEKESLKNVFDDYNKAAPLPKGFNNNDIDGILSGKSGKEMPKKIDEFGKLIKSAEKSINDHWRNKTNITAIRINNIDTNSDPNNPTILPKTTMKSTGVDNGVMVDLSVNVNLSKLSYLPADRVYSQIVSAIEFEVFNKELDKDPEVAKGDSEKENMAFGRNAKDLEPFESSANDGVATKNLITYLSAGIANFIKELFGIEPTDNQVKNIANEVVQDFSGKKAYGSAENAYDSMFDKSRLSKEPSLRELQGARIGKMLIDAETAFDMGEYDAEMSYREQASALMSESMKDSFENMKSKNPEAIQSFCTQYIASLLQSNNFSAESVSVSFIANEETNSKGKFYQDGPGGVGREIVINLATPNGKEMSLTDLIMTLTHETRHAMDSLINEERGVESGKGGNLVYTCKTTSKKNKVEKLGLIPGSEEYELLTLLDKMAYALDPNEMRGRMAELTALEFMAQMGDDSMAADIEKNKAAFERYQKKTEDYAMGVFDSSSEFNLDKLWSQYQDLKNSGELSAEAISAFEAQFEYLRELCKEGGVVQKMIPKIQQSRREATMIGKQQQIEEEFGQQME